MFVGRRNIEGFYPDSSLDDAVNRFAASARQKFAKTSGFGGLAVYSNVSAKLATKDIPTRTDRAQ